MDYKSMAIEYYQTAEALKRTLDKYKAQRKNAKGCNKQYVNGMIAKYQSLYNEVLHTAKILEQRANGKYAE